MKPPLALCLALFLGASPAPAQEIKGPDATAPAPAPAPASDAESVQELKARVAELERKTLALEESLAQVKKQFGQSESSPGADQRPQPPVRRGPSEERRKKFMSLSEESRRKFVDAVRANREAATTATPEERAKYADELFDRIYKEDQARKEQAKKDESSKDQNPK